MVSFTLSYPVSTGLTGSCPFFPSFRLLLCTPSHTCAVVPVLPSPLVASPASVVLTPGAAVGWFSVATNGELFTGDSSSILFTLTGADAGLYTVNGAAVSVEIERGMKETQYKYIRRTPTDFFFQFLSIFFFLFIFTLTQISFRRSRCNQ